MPPHLSLSSFLCVLFFALVLLVTSPSTHAELVHHSPSQVYALRLHPGQDLLDELTHITNQVPLRAGYVITCVGSLRQAALRLSNQENTTLYPNTTFEISSLVGTLCHDGLHLHMTIGDSKGRTVAGHVMKGNIIYTTAEIVLGDATDLVFTRPVDSETGYDELHVSYRKH